MRLSLWNSLVHSNENNYGNWFNDKNCDSQNTIKVVQMMMITVIHSCVSGYCCCYTAILILMMAVIDDKFDYPRFSMA